MKAFFRSIIFFTTIIGVFVICLSSLVGLYFYNRVTRDLPKIEKLSDYKPKAVTQFLASDNTLIAEIWDERRYPVSLVEIPPHVKNAFLAAEDASFYEHSGIDFISILRAVWVNFTSRKAKQGASTITQQIVKELLLSREKTYERKLKEALLSYRLESALSKDEILNLYLNQIFLGSGSFGVRAAAKTHFRKELSELTIAEAAYLGILPKKPSELSRPENFDMAMRRQRYVLNQMYRKNFISKEQFELAKKENLKIYPQTDENLYSSPYFSSHAMKVAEQIFQEKFPEISLRDPGGYTVKTTLDIRANEIAEKALKKRLKEVDKRQGWRGPIGNINAETSKKISWSELSSEDQLKKGDIYRGLVISVDSKKGIVKIRMGSLEFPIDINSVEWAKTFAFIDPKSIDIQKTRINPIQKISTGDIIEVSIADEVKGPYKLELDQTPLSQAAIGVSSIQTGEVKAIVGGFDYRASKFNRATQAFLQPGSSFKPFVYLAAIEHLKLTPSTLVPDEPISFPTADGIWMPQNFDEKFLGPITLRTALQKSRNVVSVYLLNRIGIDKVINLAKNFGISTPIPRNMSIALGTPEVHLLDMVRAYAGIGSSGYLPDEIIVKDISDREGKVIFQSESRVVNVVDPRSAFILEHMMRGVVDRGTAQNVKELGRPVAGKTGTTNDHMDAWFIGYTPDLVAGVWVGFDVKRSLGKLETGGKAAAPVFIDFMKEYLGDSPVLDFIPPEGVSPVSVDVNSGLPVDPTLPNAFIEYFKTDAIGEPSNNTFGGNLGNSPKASEEANEYLRSSDF